MQAYNPRPLWEDIDDVDEDDRDWAVSEEEYYGYDFNYDIEDYENYDD